MLPISKGKMVSDRFPHWTQPDGDTFGLAGSLPFCSLSLSQGQWPDSVQWLGGEKASALGLSAAGWALSHLVRKAHVHPRHHCLDAHTDTEAD